MEQQFLNAQSDFVSIQNQLHQTKLKGKEFQKKILNTLGSPPYNPLVKTLDFIDSQCKLCFFMLGGFFTMYIETSFDENLRLTDGFLNTYITIHNGDANKVYNELIFSMSFDRIGNIGNQYTIDDFAFPYLMYLSSAYRKRIAELYKEQKYTEKLNSN